MDKRAPDYRQEGQIEGVVELEGILRLTEKKPMYTGSVKPDSRVLRYRCE